MINLQGVDIKKVLVVTAFVLLLITPTAGSDAYERYNDKIWFDGYVEVKLTDGHIDPELHMNETRWISIILPMTSSGANESDKVWSDDYVEVELTLNMVERTDTSPPVFVRLPWEPATPAKGNDFIMINLTFTRIKFTPHFTYYFMPESSFIINATNKIQLSYSYMKGLIIVPPSQEETLTITRIDIGTLLIYGPRFLFDDKGDSYLPLRAIDEETAKGLNWLLLYEMPEDREPLRLNFHYYFTDWINESLRKGEIEIYLQETSTLTLTPALSKTSILQVIHVPPTPTTITPAPTATATEIPTLEKRVMQGFEAIFVIAGILAVAYLLRKKK